jgi:hypothetical protein
MESSYGQHTQFPDGVRQLDRPLRLAEIPASFSGLRYGLSFNS